MKRQNIRRDNHELLCVMLVLGVNSCGGTWTFTDNRFRYGVKNHATEAIGRPARIGNSGTDGGGDFIRANFLDRAEHDRGACVLPAVWSNTR